MQIAVFARSKANPFLFDATVRRYWRQRKTLCSCLWSQPLV